MLIVYIALLVLPLWGCKFSGKGFLGEESFSRDVTDSIKGVFIWLVFLSHFSGYVTYTADIDRLGKLISNELGQMIVACFLFYSGFGVCEAIGNKGADYVRSLPKNRVLKTLLHFAMAVLIYYVIRLCLGETVRLETLALSLIGWESLGNSNWYIFVILVLYLITWVSFSCVRTHTKVAALLVTVLTALLILFLHKTRWSWWYDTALCYVLGIWVSIFKDKILAALTKNNLLWCLCALASILVYEVLDNLPGGTLIMKAAKLLTAPAFCVLIMVLLTKINVSNRPLIFSGQYLFEIYILQRIPMILFKEWGVSDWNLYVYFALCVVSTLALALIFRFAISRIDRILFRTKR